jgi:HlyD family secretion protein
MTIRKWILPAALIVVGALAYLGWEYSQPEKLPAGFASSNGRIEATEIDVAAKTPGRIVSILVDEGDFVTAGQVVAHMDTDVLNAQLRESEAELRRAKSDAETARNTLAQRESEKAAEQSTLLHRQSIAELAKSRLARVQKLLRSGASTREEFDIERAGTESTAADVEAARAKVKAAEAGIATAKSQIIGAEAAVKAAQARIERIQADISETALKSPRAGRVQYRIAQPAEVLAAGGKVLNLLDLADVYMTFFLPTSAAGRVRMGTEVRLVLDAFPEYVIPARVSFVANEAQFTPKTVETAEERQKLTFRIKAQVDPKLLEKHIRSVKTGLPGMAYVQLDPQAEWPAKLEVRLPQ